MKIYKVHPLADSDRTLLIEAHSQKEAATIFLLKAPTHRDLIVRNGAELSEIVKLDDLMKENPELIKLVDAGFSSRADFEDLRRLFWNTNKYAYSTDIFACIFRFWRIEFAYAILLSIWGFGGDETPAIFKLACGVIGILLGTIIFLIIRRDRNERDAVIVRFGK